MKKQRIRAVEFEQEKMKRFIDKRAIPEEIKQAAKKEIGISADQLKEIVSGDNFGDSNTYFNWAISSWVDGWKDYFKNCPRINYY